MYPYFPYTLGNGPFHVWGENPPAFPRTVRLAAGGAAPALAGAGGKRREI